MDLVTGGTGLVGSHVLIRLLEEGRGVRALKRPTSDLEVLKKVFQYYRPSDGAALFSCIDWVDGDVIDIPSLEEAVAGVDRVFHCAAMVSYHPSDRTRLLKNNSEGTANLVNVALDRGVERFCHVSSTSALGVGIQGEPLNEKAKWVISKSNSGYGVSKYLAEREVWRGQEEGLSTVIVNPSIILGPGDPNKSSLKMFQNIKNGLAFYPPGSNGFVDSRDVARILVQLADKGIEGERFVLVGENMPFKDLFGLIAKELNVEPPSQKAGGFALELAWRAAKVGELFTGKKALMTKETARSGKRSNRYSNEKVLDTLELEMTPVKDAVKNASEFFQKENAFGNGSK